MFVPLIGLLAARSGSATKSSALQRMREAERMSLRYSHVLPFSDNAH